MDLNDAIDIARHGKTSLKSARLIFVFKKICEISQHFIA